MLFPFLLLGMSALDHALKGFVASTKRALGFVVAVDVIANFGGQCHSANAADCLFQGVSRN